MEKEKFSWKSLFIKEAENSNTTQKQVPVVETKVIQETNVTFPTINTSINDSVSNEILSKVVELYDKGFDSLNQSGYDFYEFFKAIMATDPNNPQSYIMAFTMASSMDKSITKASLLSNAEFYLAEISKVYTKYDEEGKRIKNNLVIEQTNEKDRLQTEIKSIQNKIMALQTELEQKTKLLQNYDAVNSTKVKEIEQKVMANDLAKERIVQKIARVISGINNHI
jgi:hypothetical protein